MVSKLAAYVVVGINDAGRKEVLTVEIGENESSKYWLGVLNRLKNRGVQDILLLCLDGLSGLKEAVAMAFPEMEHQRCIVHMVCNTLKYVAHKDMKFFAKELRSIYAAPDEKTALKRLEEAEKMEPPLSDSHAQMVRSLGCHNTDIQVFCGCPHLILYHEHHREPECIIPQINPATECISKCASVIKGSLSGDI